MTVLRQVQTFLLAQHSQDPIGLQEYLLRALLGVCQVGRTVSMPRLSCLLQPVVSMSILCLNFAVEV